MDTTPLSSPQAPDPGARLPAAQGTLLLVDDEPNVLHALSRLLRREPYRVLTASSGAEGLALLQTEPVDVVLSDQRMPGMTGVEFLRQAKRLRPDTVRMVLSGYTDLSSVTDAINEGATYKFLTKPWDDNFLRASILEAFARKSLSDENRRLDEELHRANEQLARYNEHLKSALEEQRRRMQLGEQVLRLAKDGLDRVPVPVIGIDQGGRIVFVNFAATLLAPAGSWAIGALARQVLPEPLAAILTRGFRRTPLPGLFERDWLVHVQPLGRDEARGALLTLLPMDPDAAVQALDDAT